MKLNELKDYFPVIITKHTYEDLLNQIKQGEQGTYRENKEKNQIQKSYNQLKREFDEFEYNTNKKTNKLNQKIEELIKDLSEKNDSLEKTLKEKEQLIIDVSVLKKSLWSYKANSDKISRHLKQAKKELNKVQREKTKLLDTVDAKERVIEEYINALEQAESKIQLQAAKINELSKEIKHQTIEYKNDGLPKSTKQSLRLKRKIRG